MTLIKDGSFPSDEIAALNDFDGTEPKDVVGWCRKFGGQFPRRIAFAINQHYPELKSGHYFNRRLIAIIQEVIGRVGLWVVIEDNYRREGIVPVEPLASLEYADDYLLVTDALQIHGRLRVWESLGGKGMFYHDKVVLDVLTDAKVADELLRTLREECRSRKIMFGAGNVAQ